MTRTASESFEFDLPSEWEDRSTGSWVVAWGPRAPDELIVTASRISGLGLEEDLQRAKARLLEGALASLRAAAANPNLTPASPMERAGVVPGCETWMLRSKTRDGKHVFLQAAVAGHRAVLIATLEAQNDESSQATFEAFLQSIVEQDLTCSGDSTPVR